MRLPLCGLIIMLLAQAAPAHAQFSAGPPWRYLSGMEVMRLDAQRVYVVRGAAADNEGRVLIEVARRLVVDIRNLGALGRDDVATAVDVAKHSAELVPDTAMPHGYRATYAPGHQFAGMPLRGWYYPVYLGSSTGGNRNDGSAMLTRQLSSMRADGPGNARAPEGFSARRHAPMTFYYDPQAGFRPMTCYGWPQPACNWTNGGTRPAYALLQNGIASDWTKVSASEWIPDTGRILRLQAVLRSTGGRGGAYVKPLAYRDDATMIGWVNAPNDVHISFFETATTSLEEFVYRVDDGVTLSLYATGYALLQPQ